MRIFHVGDLHFGKEVHALNMADEDQPFWIDQFLKAVDDHKADAVVIAGDVYDRKNPGVDAMKLFEKLVGGLVERNVYTFVVPGNHDSDGRLSHNSKLLEDKRLYIAGELKRELDHITIKNDGKDVTFWLMPYIIPKLVSVVLDTPLPSYDAAARALIDAQDIDENACNILVAHQNVLASGEEQQHSDSETIIGGVGEIDYSAFDKFDYVALGHIHNAYKVGRETVRYSGCPMYYDFSETGRWKGITCADIDENGSVSVSQIEIPLLHTMKRCEGSFAEVLEAGRMLDGKDRLYVQAVLTGRDIPPRAADRLRAEFGSCLISIKREQSAYAASASSAASSGDGSARRLSLNEQFEKFFAEMNQDGELMSRKESDIILKIMEQQTENGLSEKQPAESETDDLVDYIIGLVEVEE